MPQSFPAPPADASEPSPGNTGYPGPAGSAPGGYPTPYGPPVLPPVSVGAAWGWAWRQVREQPLVLTPMLFWTVVASVVGLLIAYLAEALPVVNQWGIVSVPFVMLASGFGVLSQTYASLTVVRGGRVSARNLVSVPHALRALVVLLIIAVVQQLAGIIGPLGLVPYYFFFMSIFVAITEDLGIFGSIGRSCSLMKTTRVLVLALAYGGLVFLGIITVVGWIVLYPVANLMASYAYVQLAGPIDRPGQS